MNTFQIFGILFIVLGATQTVVTLVFRKNPIMYLFLVMGLLFIATGVWMWRL